MTRLSRALRRYEALVARRGGIIAHRALLRQAMTELLRAEVGRRG